MVILKKKRIPPDISDGAPSGSVVTCSDSGWMDGDRFVQWMEHFIHFTQPTEDRKFLLILDGHKSHTKNLRAIQLASENNVIMLSLPPHTTHKTQTLDRTFFKPLHTFYGQAIERWLRTNPGRAVSAYQIARLFNEAYQKAATMPIAIKGFECSGI